MKYRFHIFLSLTLFLGVTLTVLEAISHLPASYLMFTLVNSRHNYPVPWKSWYSKGFLEDRANTKGCVKLVGVWFVCGLVLGLVLVYLLGWFGGFKFGFVLLKISPSQTLFCPFWEAKGVWGFHRDLLTRMNLALWRNYCFSWCFPTAACRDFRYMVQAKMLKSSHTWTNSASFEAKLC